jgi:hypothetical protein
LPKDDPETRKDAVKNKNTKRIQVTQPNLPEYEGTARTIIGNRILFVEAMHDPDCDNPCEDQDGVGHIRSLSNRHINRIGYDEAKALLESDADVVALSYYEHGNCVWMVAGSAKENTPGVEFQWDGTRFAGVWIPDDSVRESYTGQDGLSRRDWMVKQAECACETYTAWSNGDCWGYSVQVFKVRKDGDGEVFDSLEDYRRDAAEHEDSCFGFIGHDYFKDEMKDQAVYALKQVYTAQRFSKRAIAAAFKA